MDKEEIIEYYDNTTTEDTEKISKTKINSEYKKLNCIKAREARTRNKLKRMEEEARQLAELEHDNKLDETLLKLKKERRKEEKLLNIALENNKLKEARLAIEKENKRLDNIIYPQQQQNNYTPYQHPNNYALHQQPQQLQRIRFAP